MYGYIYNYYVIIIDNSTKKILMEYKSDELPNKSHKLFINNKVYEIIDIIVNMGSYDERRYMVVNINVTEVGVKYNGEFLYESSS